MFAADLHLLPLVLLCLVRASLRIEVVVVPLEQPLSSLQAMYSTPSDKILNIIMIIWGKCRV